jgi:D-amino-acid dehydrogenase
VVLLERGEIGSGASSGNAGLLVPSHFEPLARPGAVRSGLAQARDPDGAFRLRFRADPTWARWLLRFGRCCRRAVFERTCTISRALLREALEVHEALALEAGDAYGFRRDGLLYLFLTGKGLEAGLDKAARAGSVGIPVRVLDRVEARTAEPLLGGDVVGGVLYPGNRSLDPALFLAWLLKKALESAVSVRTGTEVTGFRRSRQGIRVLSSRGGVEADQVVLAAGARTGLLGSRLGLRLPVEGAKGVSLTFPSLIPGFRRPMMLEERHVAVSPGPAGLRLTGLFEMAGLDGAFPEYRGEAVLRSAVRYLPLLGGSRVSDAALWQGLRPCTPDGLPVIGRAPSVERVVLAAGHGTKGMCLGPLTGLYVARMLEGGRTGEMGRVLGPGRFR